MHSKLVLAVLLFAGLGWAGKSFSTRNKSDAHKAGRMQAQLPKAKKRVVFIAGSCSHGPGEHEHTAGCMLLSGELNKHMGDEIESQVFQLWPPDSTVLNNADALVLYMDGGEGHLALKHMDQLKSLMDKGKGLVCLHYSVEVPKEQGEAFKNWLGGYFEVDWSVNPMWEASYKALPVHPVTRGVKPFTLEDEWYYHMRFKDNMQGVTPVLTAIPPASSLSRNDGPHENNPFVRSEIGKPQHMSWVTVRGDGGRSFAFTGGHYHMNWANENVRKLVLNGIVWAAKALVPRKGVDAPPLSEEELKANLDSKPCRKI